MTRLQAREGLIIFLAILVVVLICALYVYQVSGPLGIEERFSHAVGTPNNNTNEEPEGGFFGFFIEGNPLLYIVVLALLVIACFALYNYAKW